MHGVVEETTGSDHRRHRYTIQVMEMGRLIDATQNTYAPSPYHWSSIYIVVPVRLLNPCSQGS